MKYLAFDAYIDFEPPDERIDGSLLSSEEISHYVMEWATTEGYSEREINTEGAQRFVIEFTDADYEQDEVDVQFSLRTVDTDGLESDPAFYQLTLAPSDFTVGSTANVPLGDGVVLVLFILFAGIVNRTIH
jgi:hypothetical protein|tara:strand:- start:6300 stop:6692 length:393 start_codon:yes stop_codon:yes gene_type:complete